MEEKYTPPKEEIEKAEEMAVEGHMTPEQEKDSEKRAENWEQDHEPWVPFDDDNIDENSVRKPATPEQIENMDESLKRLKHLAAEAQKIKKIREEIKN
jgi:hypothetical protein